MATSISKPFTEVEPSRTASRATGYIPPAATGGYSYTTSAASTGRPHVPNPSTPALSNDFNWINTYLVIHKMSTPSYRYSFILWIILFLAVLLFAILHWTGSRGGFLGAAWSKWALRRRTWRKKHALAQAKREGKPFKQPFSFPSNAQMLSLIFLFVVPLALCFIGPDYIAPGTKLWDLVHNTTAKVDDAFVQRDLQSRAVAATATTRSPDYTVPKAWWTVGGRTGIIAFALFPVVILFSLKAPPFAILAIPFLIQVHFDKLARLHRWTGRLIWFICTIHVVTWGIQLGRDKRGTGNPKHVHSPAWLFVWQYPLFIEGIIAYIALTLLVILSLDSFRNAHYEAFYVLHVILVPITLIFSALHFPTIWWWCWSALILWAGERTHRAIRWAFVNGLMGKDKIPSGALSINPKQASLGLNEKKQPLPAEGGGVQAWEQGVRLVRRSDDDKLDPTLLPLQPRPRGPDRDYSYESTYDQNSYGNFSLDAYSDIDPRPPNNKRMSTYSMRGEYDDRKYTNGSHADLLSPHSPTSARPLNPANHQDGQPATYPPSLHSVRPTSRIPPPGYAIAQLLPGRVIRLRLLTPRPIVWAPGQHVLLQVPAVAKLTTHPFTICNCYDNESETAEGRVVEMIVRAKNGFTKDLWEYVVRLSAQTSQQEDTQYPFADASFGNNNQDVENPRTRGGNGRLREKASFLKPHNPAGVLLRAYVDGPFGSAIKAHWGNHSTVLIVVGGTGCSFGTSILEYLCLCLAGRDGKALGGRPGGWGHKGFKTTRVRFVWLIREFSHIQWCATILRRCMELVPSSALQVDIFVSNTEVKHNNRHSMMSTHFPDASPITPEQFAPPSAQFMQQRGRSNSNSSVDSIHSGGTSALNSTIDLTYLQHGNDGFDYYHSQELGHEAHVLDYTNFDGEVDTKAPGEANINRKLQKEGKIRRAKSRRSAAAAAAKMDLEARSRQGTGGSANPPNHISPIAEHGGERNFSRPMPRSGRASPTPNMHGLPQGAYSPAAAQHPPSSFDPRLAVSAADQYRMPEGYLSATELNANRRWSQMSGGPGSPGFHSADPNRLSVISMNDLRGMSPSPVFGADSIHKLVGERPGSSAGDDGEMEPRLEIDEQELEDIQVVSEMARPGKPKLDRIVADEVGRSRGAVAVACCGPASLNALVRKIVATQINPSQVLRGEMQGMITLITEEFQW
ncbi:hypothetical protein CPB86DRAFT_696988 [Serendipita vermifera]|nr:hypothetical protein CPB86DRAFT_696988 [Serendipita vermifera]